MSSRDPKEQQDSGDDLKTGTNVQTKSGERADDSSGDAPASGQGQSSSGEAEKER